MKTTHLTNRLRTISSSFARKTLSYIFRSMSFWSHRTSRTLPGWETLSNTVVARTTRIFFNIRNSGYITVVSRGTKWTIIDRNTSGRITVSVYWALLRTWRWMNENGRSVEDLRDISECLSYFNVFKPRWTIVSRRARVKLSISTLAVDARWTRPTMIRRHPTWDISNRISWTRAYI